MTLQTLPPSLSSSRMLMALLSTTRCSLEDWKQVFAGPLSRCGIREHGREVAELRPSAAHAECFNFSGALALSSLGSVCATRAAGWLAGWG